MEESVVIEMEGVDLVVTGYYDSPEEEVRYYQDGTGHPGSSSSFDIEKIEIEGIDVTILLEHHHEKIKESVLLEIEK